MIAKGPSVLDYVCLAVLYALMVGASLLVWQACLHIFG
jgi:hypothetical protein